MKHHFIIRLFLLSFITAHLYFPLIAKLDVRLIPQDEMLDLIIQAQKDDDPSNLTEADLVEIRSISPKKSWTIMIYMAADNDLHYFAWRNLKQMEMIGSNNIASIVVQLNTPGQSNATKRYIVKQGRRLLVQDDTLLNQKLNSGNPQTLVDFAQWAVDHFPAENYALIFWNHGTGAIDPSFVRTVNPCELFYVNPTDNTLELDRNTSYLTLLYQATLNTIVSNHKRGICFDDSFKSYINNHDLLFALGEISTKILRGQKLGIIAFDACLMSMLEIANVLKNYAHFMVGSQEVEYGTGYQYELALRPFLQQTLTPQEFAQHLVLSYEQAYHAVTNEYTHSATNLSYVSALEENVNNLATLLQQTLNAQPTSGLIDILRKCKSTQYCTCFNEPSYIDIGHFYQNLLQHIQHINLSDKSKEADIKNQLRQVLQQGLTILSTVVIENRAGYKLRKAQGLSIYFPEHSIIQSYLKSPFALTNHWGSLLVKYIFG